MNSFGKYFRVTTFGESHGPAIGGVIDGMPAGVKIDTTAIQQALDNRRPGQGAMTTARSEADRIEILSGVFEGVSTGAPIGFTIANTDTRSQDYAEMERALRPSHADYTYTAKYGIRDHRGGGRSSARETAVRVAAGAIARQLTDAMGGPKVTAYTSAIGGASLPEGYELPADAKIYSSDVRCPDAETAERMRREVMAARADADSVGGVVSCVIEGCPPGLGSPVYGKLHAQLAEAMMSINAAKAFEYGMGMAGCCRRGSEMADSFTTDSHGRITTVTNHSGGIQGGISNGMPITMRIGFKPTPTIGQDLATTDIDGNAITLKARGRHDPCVVPRAVSVVEAMAYIVIADAMLENRISRL